MEISGQSFSASAFWERAVILIPALNEAASITQTVELWRRLGAKHFRVVDNGSTDKTVEVSRCAGAEVLFERRRGYGAAAWKGLQSLPREIEWILFSSADGSDRLTEVQLNEWLQQVRGGKDFILGDRFSALESRRHLKPVQSFGNCFACALIHFGWRRKFRDMGSLRLMRRTALEDLNLQDRGFGWNIEMQVRAVERGFSIVELPVGYHPRHGGESKISGNLIGTIKASWGILLMIGQLFFQQRSRRRMERFMMIKTTKKGC